MVVLVNIDVKHYLVRWMVANRRRMGPMAAGAQVRFWTPHGIVGHAGANSGSDNVLCSY